MRDFRFICLDELDFTIGRLTDEIQVIWWRAIRELEAPATRRRFIVYCIQPGQAGLAAATSRTGDGALG
jgi:hypothetical protein